MNYKKVVMIIALLLIPMLVSAEKISLVDVSIQTEEFCSNKDNILTFKTLGNESNFVMIDSVSIYLNNSLLESDDFSMDISNEEYSTNIGNLSKGMSEIIVSVNQRGHEINKSVNIESKSCYDAKKIIESKTFELISLVKDNQNLFIYGSFGMFMLIVLSVIIGVAKK